MLTHQCPAAVQFRDMALQRRVTSAGQKRDMAKYLISPGPDFVVVDEGHLIKNHKGTIFEALQNIRSKRRLVLTGSPLQNNRRSQQLLPMLPDCHEFYSSSLLFRQSPQFKYSKWYR